MLLTNKRIEVTEEMLFKKGLYKYLYNCTIGVPQKNGKVSWKHMFNLSEEDYDLLEDYFLNQIQVTT